MGETESADRWWIFGDKITQQQKTKITIKSPWNGDFTFLRGSISILIMIYLNPSFFRNQLFLVGAVCCRIFHLT